MRATPAEMPSRGHRKSWATTAISIALDPVRRASRDMLVLQHLEMAGRIARAVRWSYGLSPLIELDDLIQAGRLALINAASMFRPELQVPFTAFAGVCIRGAIMDSIRRKNWKEDMHERLPDFAESLADGDSRTTPSDRIRNLSKNPEGEWALIDQYRRLMEVLDERQRFLIQQRYERTISLSASAALLGVSPSRGSQLHRQALKLMSRQASRLGLHL